MSAQQRRLLVVACGGAGLAAVHNVPLAGALFTAEILIGGISLPAIVCSWIATATARVYLPNHAVYPGIPDYRLTWSLMTWALLAGPVIALISAGYIRLIGWVSHHRVRGARALFAPCWPSAVSRSSASGIRSCSGTAWTWPATRSSASAASACC
jgi:CIC family chloride channel protein